MKRVLSLALPLILASALGAVAQSDTTPSTSSTNQAKSPGASSSPESNRQSSSPTANPGSSSTMAQSGTTATSSPSVEGCIERQQTEYYLQPETGQAIRLNSSQDLGAHVGHRVRVEGTMNQGTASNPGSNTYGKDGTSATTNATGGTSSTSADRSSTAVQSDSAQAASGGPAQEMLVTRVDMISETCPAGMQNSPKNSPAESPK